MTRSQGKGGPKTITTNVEGLPLNGGVHKVSDLSAFLRKSFQSGKEVEGDLY